MNTDLLDSSHRYPIDIMTSLDSDYPLTIDMLTDLFLLPYRSMITDLDSSNHIHVLGIITNLDYTLVL